MKNKGIYILFIILVANVAACSSDNSNRYGSSLPSFDLLLLDSTTLLNTTQIPAGNPIVFLYFSPDCEHCQTEVNGLTNHMDELKNARFYFCTPFSMSDLRTFNRNYHLSDYKNITVARDYKFSFFNQFKIKSVPFLAIYDKQKRFIKAYYGDHGIASIEATIKNN